MTPGVWRELGIFTAWATAFILLLLFGRRLHRRWSQ